MSTPRRPAAPPERRTPTPPERRTDTQPARRFDSPLEAVTVPQLLVDRGAERRAAARRRRLVTWGRRAAWVALAGMAVWLVLLSPLFALDPAKVQVTGYGTVVDPTAVRDAVATHEGRSLALLSVGSVASELRDIPGVREAHVTRKWPDALVITLVSREPVAAIPDAVGGYLLVDDQGVQVGRAAAADDGLPVLQVPAGSAKVLSAALAVINALPADLAGRLETVSATTEDSVSFTLRDGPHVEWGSAENSELKAKVLGVLLGSKAAKKADVIDVSAPTLPITKSS